MDPQVLIAKLLGEDPMTGNAYVGRNFPDMRYDPNFLSHVAPSENIVDRRVSDEDVTGDPQEYIRQAFEELLDPRVR